MRRTASRRSDTGRLGQTKGRAVTTAAMGATGAAAMRRVVHPIEEESYAILRARVATGHLPPYTRAVVERVVHASADPAYVEDLVTEEGSLAAAAAALRAGAPIVADVGMVAAGVTSRSVVCGLNDPRSAALAAQEGITRSAAGVRVALEEVGPGAVWVVGCAPTALMELLALRSEVAPALVIGLPVGFVGASEAKAALRDRGLAQVSNRSEKGGSAVAAAALNALLYETAQHGLVQDGTAQAQAGRSRP